jgi:GT2 family glycosyltransferase
MTVSVIVPSFNGGPWIREQLAALSNQTYAGDWELVVGDNGSTVVLHRRPRSAKVTWRKEFAYGRGWTMLERRYPEVSPNGWAGPLLQRAGWVALRVPYVALPARRRAWVVRAAGVAGRLVERVHPTA